MVAQDSLQRVVSIAAKHAERVDAESVFPVDAIDALRASGLLGLVLPRDDGGMGSGPEEFTEVVAETGRRLRIDRHDLSHACFGRRRRRGGTAGGSARPVARHGLRKVPGHLGIQ